MEELLNSSLQAHLANLDAQLGKHKRMRKPKKGDRPCLLLGIEFTDNKYIDLGGSNLDELERLATTADLCPQCRIIQKRRSPHAGTFIGKGKVDEVRDLILDEALELVLVGCDLPYTTIHKLSAALGVPVLDRSQLILEIFASHAMTNEGRLQVKLAQLDHSMHRLLKEEKDLDRQGGGIGMRGGAGETASTLVKRRIHQKKQRLEKRLDVIHQQREEGRFLRASGPVARVAMAGYTNAGKSTLLNALCGSVEAEAADKFFTTLTTTTRRIELPSGRPMLLSDTVGFVEKLPHHLVAAFESTLSESACADLTLVVVQSDITTLDRHKATVDKVLTDLGQPLEKRLTILTKIDLLSAEERKELEDLYPGVIGISSVTGEGVQELLNVISGLLSKGETEIELLLPFNEMALVDELHRFGQIIRKEWTEDGFKLRARLPEQSLDKLKKFEVL
jgi:GTP-binding protein HflX